MEYPPSMQLVYTFMLQFYFLFGKLEGFRLIGEKTAGAETIISQERLAVIIHIKTFWEAFCQVARQELTIEPEDLLMDYSRDESPNDNHLLRNLAQMKDEMARVQADPFRLAQTVKRYALMADKGPQGPNVYPVL